MLTATVGEAALSSQKIIQALNLTLFALAGCLGIGAGIFVSAHIVRALRRLAEGTAAVQAGHFMVTVPVETDDEVGQLATAFNRMVEEIRTREKIKEAFGKFVDPRIVANLITTTSGEYRSRRASGSYRIFLGYRRLHIDERTTNCLRHRQHA